VVEDVVNSLHGATVGKGIRGGAGGSDVLRRSERYWDYRGDARRLMIAMLDKQRTLVRWFILEMRGRRREGTDSRGTISVTVLALTITVFLTII
jgi:hypothetical protein